MNKIVSKLQEIFRRGHERKITWGLIGTGLLILMSGFTQNYWWSIVFSLVNLFFDTELNYPSESVEYIVLFSSLVVGFILILIGIKFYFETKEPEIKNTLLRIFHSSIESVSYSKVDKELSEAIVEDQFLNQIEEMKNINNSSLQHALKEQEKFVRKTLNRIDDKSNMEVGYFGLAHVPLVFLLGFQMADKLSPTFFEWNQNNQLWEKVEKRKVKYPQLLSTKSEENQQIEEVVDLVVKVGITYPIPDSDLAGLDLEGLNSYYLHLERPHRNAVISSNQLNDYQKKFRDLLDNLNQKYPNLEIIHLFYSGQPSLAYRLGSVISSRMDVETIVYNYVKTESPKYKWSLNLRKIGEPIKIRIVGEDKDTNV